MFSRLEFLIVVVSLLYNSICLEEIKASSHPRSLLSQVEEARHQQTKALGSNSLEVPTFLVGG